VHPLAGGDFVGNAPTNYWTNNPTATDGTRWTSARLVSTGIRVYPTASNYTKTGMLTGGIIPGKTLRYDAI